MEDLPEHPTQIRQSFLVEAARISVCTVIDIEDNPVIIGDSVNRGIGGRKPVIATLVKGLPDAVAHGVTDLLVPFDDPAPLVDAVRMLNAESGLCTRLGEAAREVVRMKFRQDIVIEKLSVFYETLVDSRLAAVSERGDE